MRILLINSRYVYMGGPERYLFNLKEILEANGHEVIPFSIQYKQNEPSKFESYFVSPIDDAILYKDQKWTPGTFYRTLERNFYSPEVESQLSALIDRVKPDFAIVMLYLRKLSPAVLVALSKKKVPFFVRLSDYGMICPSNNLFRDNKICELCTTGERLHSVQHKCVHNSTGASVVNYLATSFHLQKGYFDLIRHFVSPSKALIAKMIEKGWEPKRFSYLPTVASAVPTSKDDAPKRQIMYAGRLVYLKGVHVLLEAFRGLNSKESGIWLKIAGSGDPAYVTSLKEYCRNHQLTNVEFLGDLSKKDLFELYRESLVSVVPSLCYDNLPNSALESLSMGTPVLAPAHGSFPEFIVEGRNGFLFKPADAADLGRKLDLVCNQMDYHESLRRGCLESVAANFSAQVHYDRLMEIVDGIIATTNRKM